MKTQYEFHKLLKYINDGNIEAIKSIMSEYNLEIKDGRLYAKDMNFAKEQEQFWDQRQYVIKILLNSLYGTLLNKHCKFFHHDVGQSTTLSGRRVAHHMNSYVNKIITGTYDYKGDAIIYADTDSIFSDTAINYIEDNIEKKCTIEELFNKCSEHQEWVNNDKHYSWHPDIKLIHYDPETDEIKYGDFNYLYRHSSNKEKWEITSEDGKSIIVTEDHSCMVERDGELIKVKPCEMLEDDILLVLE